MEAINTFKLTIPESKTAFVLQLLGELSYTRIQPLNEQEEWIAQKFESALQELHEVKTGKKKAIPVEKLLHDL